MMAFKVAGQSTDSTLSIEFTASGGGTFAINADATPTLEIYFGGVLVETVTNSTNPSTGTYVATWTPTVAGQYDLEWSFEVTGVPYKVDDVVFALDPVVSASTSGGFITVDTTSGTSFSSSLIQGEFTYRSGSSPNLYQFTIVYEISGQLSVREIENPYGQVVSPYTRIPRSVSDDIALAMQQVENLLGLSSAVSGTINFSGETSKSVVFSTPLANATYRVQLTSDVFAPFRISVKSRQGFTVEVGSAITGQVTFDVFV